MDGNPIALPYRPLHGNGAVRSRETTTQRGRNSARNTFRQRHQVAVRISRCHIFGERSPAVEAWLKLSIADVLIAPFTFEAFATTGNKRHRHALPNEFAAHFAPNG